MQGHRRRGGGLKERIEVQIDKLLLVPPPGFLDPPPPLMCRKIEVCTCKRLATQTPNGEF